MPTFMCVHEDAAQGLTQEQVAAEHQRDLAVQGKHGVRFVRYWFDPVTGKGFCLSEAPNRELVLASHREAHPDVTFTADEIFEVFGGE